MSSSLDKSSKVPKRFFETEHFRLGFDSVSGVHSVKDMSQAGSSSSSRAVLCCRDESGLKMMLDKNKKLISALI